MRISIGTMYIIMDLTDWLNRPSICNNVMILLLSYNNYKRKRIIHGTPSFYCTYHQSAIIVSRRVNQMSGIYRLDPIYYGKCNFPVVNYSIMCTYYILLLCCTFMRIYVL